MPIVKLIQVVYEAIVITFILKYLSLIHPPVVDMIVLALNKLRNSHFPLLLLFAATCPSIQYDA